MSQGADLVKVLEGGVGGGNILPSPLWKQGLGEEGVGGIHLLFKFSKKIKSERSYSKNQLFAIFIAHCKTCTCHSVLRFQELENSFHVSSQWIN